jgi:hypothetical protein
VRLIFRYCTCNERVVDTQRVLLTHERILVEIDSSIVCVQCAPDTFGINLARFPVGHHRFLTEVTYRWGSSDSLATHTDYYVTEFDVRPACGQEQRDPIPDRREHWNRRAVHGVPAARVRGGQCPGLPAWRVPRRELRARRGDRDAGLALADSDVAGPARLQPRLQRRPGADPVVGFVPDCARWSTGSNGLRVTAYLRDDCHAGVPQWIGEARFPISVDQCEGQRDCYSASFLRQPGPCDASVAPGNPGFVWLGINSDRAIGGVQGRLVFDRPGLHVQSIEPAYAGSVLKWDRTADGANFVIVVPPDSMPPSPPDVLRMLLSVRVALDVGAVIDGIVRLQPVDLLVSDPAGQRVQQCTRLIIGPGPVEVVDNFARFCTEVGCDFNGDGRADVRDLVLMVNCLLYPPPNARCPAPPDCNGDERHDLDDVLCCARRILHGSPPDSAHAVPAPEVTLAFGTPVLVAGGVDLPVMVGGIGRIGATRLEFSYPDEAFASASVELNDPSGHWLALDEASGGRVVFGGIRLSPEDATGALPLTLHLRTRAGQAGGRIRLVRRGGLLRWQRRGAGHLGAAGDDADRRRQEYRAARGAAEPVRRRDALRRRAGASGRARGRHLRSRGTARRDPVQGARSRGHARDHLAEDARRRVARAVGHVLLPDRQRRRAAGREGARPRPRLRILCRRPAPFDRRLVAASNAQAASRSEAIIETPASSCYLCCPDLIPG